MLQFHCHCFSLYSRLLAVLGIHTLASVSLFFPLFQVVGSSGNPYTCFSFTVTVSPSIPGCWQFWESIHLLQFHCHCFSLYSRLLAVLGIHTHASVSLSLFLPSFQVAGSSGNPYTCFSFTVTVSPSIPGCWQFWESIHLRQFHCHCFSLHSRLLAVLGIHTLASVSLSLFLPLFQVVGEFWDTIHLLLFHCFSLYSRSFTVTFSLYFRLLAVLGHHTIASVSLSLFLPLFQVVGSSGNPYTCFSFTVTVSPSIPGCWQFWESIHLLQFHGHCFFLYSRLLAVLGIHTLASVLLSLFLPLFQVVGSSGNPYTCFTLTVTFLLHYRLLVALGIQTLASVSLSLFLPLFQVVGSSGNPYTCFSFMVTVSPSIPGCWQFWESIHLLQFHGHCFSLYSRSLAVLGIHTLASVSLSLFLPLFQVVGSSGNPYTCFSFTVTVSSSIPGRWQFWESIHLLQFHGHCFFLYSRSLAVLGIHTLASVSLSLFLPLFQVVGSSGNPYNCFSFTVTFSLYSRLLVALGHHTIASVSLSLSPSIPGCWQLWESIHLLQFHCHCFSLYSRLLAALGIHTLASVLLSLFLPLFQVVGSSGNPYTCFSFTVTVSPSIPGCW